MFELVVVFDGECARFPGIVGGSSTQPETYRWGPFSSMERDKALEMMTALASREHVLSVRLAYIESTTPEPE